MFAGMLFWFFVKFSFGRTLLIKVQQKKTTIWQYRVSCHSYWSIYINKSCPKKCCGAHVLPAFSQYPELFSFGLFSKAGPTKKQVRCIHSTLSWLWKKDHCRLTNLSYVCVCVCFYVRWTSHPSSLPSMERVTQRSRTPQRENQMAKSASWFRVQVTASQSSLCVILGFDPNTCYIFSSSPWVLVLVTVLFFSFSFKVTRCKYSVPVSRLKKTESKKSMKTYLISCTLHLFSVLSHMQHNLIGFMLCT